MADAIRTSLGPKGMDKMVRLDKIFVLEFVWEFSAHLVRNLPQNGLITIDEHCDCPDNSKLMRKYACVAGKMTICRSLIREAK